MKYQHTQIGYLMLVVTVAVLVLFTWLQITARTEPPSVDSGTNFAFTAIMVLILCTLASFVSLQVTIDDTFLRIKFGYGVFRKKFTLSEIASVRSVKNRWYYSWGIHLWLWPMFWVYNVSGFDAVEIVLKNNRRYRIGTDEPQKLEEALKSNLHLV